MESRTCAFALCGLIRLLLIATAVSCDQSVEADEPIQSSNWGQWRGPLGTGESPDADPPVEWSDSRNIRWKASIPGHGHSTPVVWGDRIFVTTAVPFGEAMEPRYSDAPGAHDNLPVTHRHRFLVLSINRRNGEVVWSKTVHEELPHEAGHFTASLASNSPVTDGRLVIAHFGSRGLYALRSSDGSLVWKKDLGKMQTKHGHGEGSSPVLHDDTLVVNWDHEGASRVMAFHKGTGDELWKLERDEVTSWATPIVVEHAGVSQVIISGTDRVRGHELATGKVIWECGGLSANIVASPVAADGMVYAGSSYEIRAMLAIQLDGARGDITGTDQVVWTRKLRTPYVPSPLLYQGSIYFLRHYQGILTRVVAKTGEEPVGPFRLGGIRDVYASPVAAADRIYVTDRSGTTMVISHEEEPRVLATNRIDDSFNASAVLVGRELYLRGEKTLYCIADEQSGN